MGISDEMGTNGGRLKEEMNAYMDEIRDVIIPGIKNSRQDAERKGRNPFLYKLHKCSAFVEEWYDKCPRWNAYLWWLRWCVLHPIVIYWIWGIHS